MDSVILKRNFTKFQCRIWKFIVFYKICIVFNLCLVWALLLPPPPTTPPVRISVWEKILYLFIFLFFFIYRTLVRNLKNIFMSESIDNVFVFIYFYFFIGRSLILETLFNWKWIFLWICGHFFFFCCLTKERKQTSFWFMKDFYTPTFWKKKQTFFCKEIKYGAAHIFVKMIYNSCCQQPIKNIINLNIVIFQLNRVKVWNISWQYFFCLSLIVYFYK